MLRPIRPEDEPLMVKFHQELSEHSVYMRYFHFLSLGRRVAHERLSRICYIDYDREIVLVADYASPKSGEHEILGVARLNKLQNTDEAEIALVVRDAFQHRGLGLAMLERLIDVARTEGLHHLSAEILTENRDMQDLCQRTGFRIEHALGEGTVTARLHL